ncbi:MAG: EAL domain-containing protein [Filomicrobium sp.]
MSAYVAAVSDSMNRFAKAVPGLQNFINCDIRFRQARLFALLLLSVVVIASVGYSAARHSIAVLGEREAETVSKEWVKVLTEQFPGIADLARGRDLTEAESKVLHLFKKFGDAYRFSIFAPDGRRIVTTGAKFGVQTGSMFWPSFDAAAKQVATSNSVKVTSFKNTDKLGHPDRYTHVLSPIREGGKVIAVLEVYIDDTKRLQFLEKYAVSIAVVTGLFAVIAFALPGLALYHHAVRSAEVTEDLKYLACHDAMTGLVNRATFDKQLTTAIDKASIINPAGLIRIDLDKFKSINDSHGHDVGDKVLIEIANRLKNCVRDCESVARVGGDEFAVIVTVLPSRLQLGRIGRRIVKELSKPFEVNGLMLPMGGSVGMIMLPEDASHIEDAMKRSDVALYRAKSLGRTRAVFYREKLNEEYERKREIEADLKLALQNNEFELNYQPIVDCETRTIKAFEALIRWNSPRRGLVSPLEFIPLAEETGLIEDIGDWVIRTSVADASQWPDNVVVSVNVSAHQMRCFRVYDTVKDALKKHGMSGKRLAIEVTESAVLEDADRALEVLDKLHSLGVRLAIDDFGTGYSSLTYLHKFPFDNVKIDRTFIQSFFSDNSSKEIVRAVVDLGSNLGKHTIAEGVETEVQAAALAEMNCAAMQGYLISRPVKFDETLKLLTTSGIEEELAKLDAVDAGTSDAPGAEENEPAQIVA